MESLEPSSTVTFIHDPKIADNAGIFVYPIIVRKRNRDVLNSLVIECRLQIGKRNLTLLNRARKNYLKWLVENLPARAGASLPNPGLEDCLPNTFTPITQFKLFIIVGLIEKLT